MGYVFSKKSDFALFSLPVLLGLLIFFIFGRHFSQAPNLWLIFNIVVLITLDIGHGYATLFYVYFVPDEIQSRPWSVLFIPLFVFVCFLILSSIFTNYLVWLIVVYYSIWHFCRQQIGWLNWTSRDSLNQYKTDHLIIYTSTLGAVFYWHLEGIDAIWGWGIHFPLFETIPAHIFELFYWSLPTVYILLQLWRIVFNNERINWGKYQIIGVTVISWGLALVTFHQSPIAFSLLVLMPHGIQYFFLLNKQIRSTNMLFWKGLSPLFFLLIFSLILGFYEESIRGWIYEHPKGYLKNPNWTNASEILYNFFQALIITPIVSHYVFDSILWKRGTNPLLGKWLWN